MDWVQNKSTGKKIRSDKGENESSEALSKTASGWLEDLCRENIELLKASLPVPKLSRSKKKKASVKRPTIDALDWGVAALQVEETVDLEYLSALIEANGPDGSERPRISPEKIAKWIGKQLPRRSEEPLIALIAAGWIHGLPKLGSQLEPGLWLEILQSILCQVDRAWLEKDPESTLAWLIWSCEVPIALAAQLSQLGCNDRIVSETLDRLALVLELTKENPSPWLTRGGSQLRALLACVLRCRWTADQLGARKWYSQQRKSLSQLAIQAVTLSDSEGKPLLIDEEAGETDAPFWTALFEATEQNAKLADAMRMLPKPLRPPELRKRASIKSGTFKPGHYDAGAEIATMRRDWQSNSCRVAVDFAKDPMWLDVLGNRGERLLSGWWEIGVTKNGKPLDVDTGWAEVCWFHDDDVDYLEVQCEVEGECILQRQLLLAREEGLVLLADALIGSEVAQWEMESRLPLASKIQFSQEAKTREGFLVRDEEKEPRALLLPLAYPEWRKLNSSGEITQENDAIVMTQRCHGQRSYLPLAVALRKRHQTAAYTWRQLTVAQDMEILPRDVATAYRIQIGKEQWVVYRSLTSSTRRTAMGLHLNSEFYAGRFDSEDGQYEALVEVDAESA